jgi:hypothetical protein
VLNENSYKKSINYYNGKGVDFAPSIFWKILKNAYRNYLHGSEKPIDVK